MPVVFVGHGSPMNAIEDNAWARGFAQLGDALPPPRAILSISAHWFVPGTYLTANEHPDTIHDFGGFPRALFEVQYPAPGSRDLAEQVRDLLAEQHASLSSDWGLDHGTWSVLRRMRPAADVPVVQLSIDRRLAPEQHFEIGRALGPLREHGVLILGSGNVTHNLGHAFRSMQTGDTTRPSWAADFDRAIEAATVQHDRAYLLGALATPHGRMCHPSPDHYYPLLYTAGAADAADAVAFPITGWDLGSLSMRAVRYG
jgi:4,5-DOPA dioxygenase extradiol